MNHIIEGTFMKQGAVNIQLSEKDILQTFEELGLDNESERKKYSFFVASEEIKAKQNLEITIADHTAFLNKEE